MLFYEVQKRFWKWAICPFFISRDGMYAAGAWMRWSGDFQGRNVCRGRMDAYGGDFLDGEEFTLAGIQTQLENMLEPVVLSLGCELWGMDYRAHGKKSLLRLYIDKPGGVALDDCERVSRQVASVLDVEDPIAGEYVLEVSSPGMDRSFYKLAQYADFIGETFAIKLRMPFEGRRKFTGVLTAVENDEVVLRVDDEEYLLPYELIDKANLVPRF